MAQDQDRINRKRKLSSSTSSATSLSPTFNNRADGIANEHLDFLVDESGKILTIDDLSEVLAILRKHQFNSGDYFNFFLDLGLLYRTISEIEAKYQKDPANCLRECSVMWLNKADRVQDPTWHVLIKALRSLNKVAAADGIDKEKHAACVLFTRHVSEDFIKNSCPKKFSDIILLVREMNRMKLSECTDSSKLFHALKMEICFNHKNLQKFAEFLCNSPATRNMGNIIMQDYVRVFGNGDVTMYSEGVTRKSKSIKISVSSDKSDEFEERRADLASTLVRIIDVVIGIGVEVEKLKEYLRICYAPSDPDLKLSINKCKTTAEIIEWIGERCCSLTKIRPLEQVMEHFEIKKAISIIQEYNIRNKNFKEKTSLHQCLNKLFSISSVLQLKEAVFVVNKRVKDCTIKDIEEFIDVAFEDLSLEVRVSVIKKGNSFSIFCSFPVMLSESLILTALKNLKVLKDNGLLKLTIGYCTVYDYKDQSLCYPEKGEASDEYISAVCTSRGMLEQLLISTSIQLMYREDQNEEDSKEIRALKEEIELLNEQLSSFQDLSEKKEDYPLEKEVPQAEKSPMVEDTTIEKMKQEIQEKDFLIAKKKKETSPLHTTIEKMKQEIQEKDFLIAKKMKETSELTETLKDNTEEMKNKDAKISADGLELISLKEKLAEKEIMTRAYQTEANYRIPTLNFVDDAMYTPPVDVIMMSFDKYNKLDEDWYSQAFYTHTNGYKMCLCIRYDDTKKSSNLHAHLMVGDYDDDLQWPFRGTLMTEILHRKTRTFRFLAEIVFDDDKLCGRIWNGVPIEAGIASSIVGEGISFAEAVQEPFTEYLEDNSIVFRVKSVNVESLVRTSAITSPPPIKEEMVFEITEFSHHKKSNSERISEGFYSAKGYKFVLMVYPNGRSHFQGRSVSIFAHISMGDYDNGLPFPFRGKIIVQIVNRLDTLRNHVEKTIEFTDKTDPEERFGAKVTGLTRFFGSGHSHQGFGYHDMLRHKFLMFNPKHRTQYLKDDSLIVRVTRIEDYNV